MHALLAVILALSLGAPSAIAETSTGRYIAPEMNALAQVLSQHLDPSPAGGQAPRPVPAQPLLVHGMPLYAPALVAAFYAARDFAPLWQATTAGVGASGQASSESAAQSNAAQGNAAQGNAAQGNASPGGARIEDLLEALRYADDHGLPPAAYHYYLLERLREQPAYAADLELLATDAYIRQALHRAQGRILAPSVDLEWHLTVEEADPLAALRLVEQGHSVAFALDALWPIAPEYWRLLAEKRRLRAAAPTAPLHAPIEPGPLLRKDSHGPRVAALRARLGLPEPHDPLFDTALEDAVRYFQQTQGLAIDGIVGANTLELLNLTDAARITRIDVNLERWRWLMQALPGRHVQVNVADYSLRVLDDHQTVMQMNVIVGTPYRRTPVFTEAMTYVVFNPDWSVPRRIAVQDKLPLLKADAAAMAAQGYEARRAGSPAAMQSVDAFDWSGVTAANFNYLLRQRPGTNNALGQVKLILPNPHAVYLHDTPARELFARSGRAFSSGCIRLERAMDLAAWVLQDQAQWTREAIDAVVESGATVTVVLRRPLPVLVLYFTAVAGESGTVYYRPDLYNRDAAVAAALGLTDQGLAAR